MSENNFLIQRSSEDAPKLRSYALQWIGMILIALALTACGGGSSDSDSGSVTTASTPTGGGTPTGGSDPVDPNAMPDPVDPNNPNTPAPINDEALFAATLHPLLLDPLNGCVGCHAALVIPLFATADASASYAATVGQQKVDLNNPANSRMYLRPAIDRHNCGGVANCDRVAADFLAAIQSWAAQSNVAAAPPAATVVASASTNFSQAVEGSVARADANLITMFKFDEGAGNVARGTSNVGADITLNLEGTEWVAEGGLRNVSGKGQASLADSQKLFNLLSGGNQFSVEAWVQPENLDQTGPARIVSYSIDTGRRNFTLGQRTVQYISRVQTLETGPNGSNPELRADDPAVTTDLAHVVMTYDNMAGGRKIYINGALAAEETIQGDMLNWQDDNLFVIGNEVTNNRLFSGVFKMVAIHNTALNAAAIAQNFEAGAGNITALRFDVANVLGQPGYIEMQSSQIDPFAYVFAKPVLVTDATGVAVKNMRIMVNNAYPIAGQSFRRVDTVVMTSGQEISPLGALITSDLGMDLDQFHLEFEMLGGQTGEAEMISAATPPAPPADVEEPDVGVRTFSQVHDTMAALTGISQGDNDVRNRYNELRDQLPPSSNVLGFGAAQQIAIQRLATTYCGEITNDNNRCENFFNIGNCLVANAAAKDAIAGTVYDKIIGNNLVNQPDRTATIAELVMIMNDLNCANGCNNDQGREVLQAVCTSALASSAVTIN
ncbi:MAG: LamG domain-containing protein [Gammaproteobacteria bacterium]